MKDVLVRINNLIWDTDLRTSPLLLSWLVRITRIFYVVIRDMADGQLTLRAMSLVYTTLLSLVPLIAVSFSVLKGFGVHNQIEPLMLNLLAPLGEKGVEITSNIIGFVENVKVGVLGSLGLFVLLYTVIALIQKIERAFNYTWHVSQQRPLAQRISDYLSVILVGPVLIFTALGITATVTSAEIVQTLSAIEPFGYIINLASTLLPFLLVITAFTFIYTFVPNVKVKFRSALVGALVAGVLWESTGWAFASFVVNSAKYAAIYSAFATLIMFMIWLYLSWLILLVGASIAFYHQHPEYLSLQQRILLISNRIKEQLSLQVMQLVADNFYYHRPPWSVDTLAFKLKIPMTVMEIVVGVLEKGGLLKATDDDPHTYLPVQPLERTSLKQVLDIVRSSDEQQYMGPDRIHASPEIVDLITYLDRTTEDALEGRSLQDLIFSTEEQDNVVHNNFQKETNNPDM